MQLGGGGAREGIVLAVGRTPSLAPAGARTLRALVEVGGVPMLERCVLRMVEAGVERIAVAVADGADHVEELVRSRGGWGVEVALAREGSPGVDGAIRRARDLLGNEGPLLVHDVGVFSDLPLGGLYEAHLRESPLATLAVRLRASRAPLLFDAEGLVGVEWPSGEREIVRETRGRVRSLDFDGIQVLSPALADRMSEGEDVPLVPILLRQAGEGERILPFRSEGTRWWDVGSPEGLEGARAHVAGRSRRGRLSTG